VARNNTNVLDLPVTRLLVGWSNGMPAAVTRFRLWIPTNTGGVLTLKGPKGGTVDLRRPFGNVIKQAADTVTYEVKTGEFGEFWAIARGAANASVYCTFIQTSFARDGSGDSDPPLVPWNFWYWPSSQGNFYQTQAGDIMARYGKAFGHDADACRAAELKDHATPAPAGGGADWQGHCHMAAAASATFEEPKGTKIKDEMFSVEEMKYLAAEYFGNFGNNALAWELKRGQIIDTLYLPAYFKPGESKGRAAFVDSIKHLYRSAGEELDSEKLVAFAERNADMFITQAGGEAAFEKLMNQWFGELAAEFYQALIDNMRVKKHPLEANMRSYRASGGPEEVWNQVYFWYSAHYSEASAHERGFDGLQDDSDMTIYCEMRANRDFNLYGASTGLPATINGNDVTPTDGPSLLFKHLWRIKFDDDSGNIVVKDPHNGWLSLHGDDAQSLYAPTKLLKMTTLAPGRLRGDVHELGNKFLGTELLKGGWLKARKRYQ
jgi:hypothetical protein